VAELVIGGRQVEDDHPKSVGAQPIGNRATNS